MTLLDEPRTVPQIADRLGLQRQSVQRVVNELSSADVTASEMNRARAVLERINRAIAEFDHRPRGTVS